MEQKNKITFLNIKDNLKALLAFQGIQYIADIRKEGYAINKFVMEGITAEYVIELIGKLIIIKKHKNYLKDTFWIGCAVNLSDAYSYRVKIETVYAGIKAMEENDWTVFKPVQSYTFEHTNKGFVPVKTGLKPVSTNKPVKEQTFTTWEQFLDWANKNLTVSNREILKDLKAEIRPESIELNIPVSVFLKKVIEKSFGKKVE